MVQVPSPSDPLRAAGNLQPVDGNVALPVSFRGDPQMVQRPDDRFQKGGILILIRAVSPYERIIQVAKIVIDRAAARKAADESDPVLTGSGKIDFRKNILKTPADD